MGSDQHFCLRWNNFHSNIAASFEHLRDHEDFVDVTLACEGRSLKAHKIVLSACSPFFKNLLKQNPCQHPIIILRDVAFPDLSALLSFVYQGEVYVSQERLPAFLRTAEMLHIKGLTEQNHPSSTGHGLSIGPPTCTTVLQATHDQGIISNKVSGMNITASSPRSPINHISPPPKKRRPTTTITALPCESPTTTSLTPPSLTPPRLEVLSNDQQEGISTLPTHHPPLPFQLRSSELIVTPSSRLPSSIPLSSSACSQDVPKVKQENQEDIKEIKEEGPHHHHSAEEAVNLVMEGSILRQRIQGYQGGSPELPLSLGNGRPPSLSILSSHDDSSLDESYKDSEGCNDAAEHEGSPMVIRSPLVGLLPMDAPGLYGGAGTSGSLGHHDSSQDMVLNLSTGCSPKDTKKWPSRQPVNCQYCGVRISMAFNLRNHVKRCKMRPFTPNTGQSLRSSSVSCVPQTHQQSSESEEALEDSPFDSGGGHLPSLSQGVPQQVLSLDTHQLVPPRSQTPVSGGTGALPSTSEWGGQQ